MSRLTDLSFVDLLSAFQSSDPTPGGGSASALSGAVGASLLAMVAGLPKPRATTAEDVDRLHASRTQCLRLCERLALLVDRDSEAYEAVMRAYRLPKATGADKASRVAAIQDALGLATEVPLEVMRACADGADQAIIVAELGNRNASSDVRVGVELLLAGLRGGRLNVEINLNQLEDAPYVAAVGEEAARLADAAARAGEAANHTLTASG